MHSMSSRKRPRGSGEKEKRGKRAANAHRFVSSKEPLEMLMFVLSRKKIMSLLLFVFYTNRFSPWELKNGLAADSGSVVSQANAALLSQRLVLLGLLHRGAVIHR